MTSKRKLEEKIAESKRLSYPKTITGIIRPEKQKVETTKR